MFQSRACPHPVFQPGRNRAGCVRLYTPTPADICRQGSDSVARVRASFIYIYVFDQITQANIGLNRVPSGFRRSHADIFWVINSSMMNLEPVAWCLCQCPAGGAARFLFANTSLNGENCRVDFFFSCFLAWWIVKSKYRRRREDRRPLAACHIQ